MVLKPLNIFAGILLVSGAGEALSASNDMPPSPSALSIPNLKITPRRTLKTGTVVIPELSIPKPGDAGHRAHTNIRVFVPGEQPQGKPQTPGATPKEAPPVSGLFFETPASLACIYGLVKETPGCDPNKVTLVPNGGTKTVAIVDAYVNTSIMDDLVAYSSQFGLPAPNLNVQAITSSAPTCTAPPTDPTFGSQLEEALDVEMVHALAPNAKIILVEAATDCDDDLLAAEDVASQLVGAAGGGEISNSWGEDESTAPTGTDSHFSTPNIVYFAAAGDAPGVSWPANSANVVAVGGTSTSRSFTTGAFLFESAWADGGGGSSTVVSRPQFQNHIEPIVGTQRGVPDIAFDANPYTGVWVVCGTGCGNTSSSWYVVGGTSVASPAVAAMVNAAGRFAPSTAAELTRIYATYGWPARFALVQRGVCGPSAGFFPHLTDEGWSVTPWNFCTGVGTPRGLSGL